MATTYDVNFDPTDIQAAASQGRMPLSTTMTEDEVTAFENTPEYKAFTLYAGGGTDPVTGQIVTGELANRNSPFTRQYVEALVHNLRQVAPNAFKVENGREVYIGDENSVLLQDENGYYINLAAWNEARTDGIWGFIHQYKLKRPAENNTVLNTNTTDNYSYKNPFSNITTTPSTSTLKPERQSWTDWIAHTALLINAKKANRRDKELELQMVFPKTVVPQKNAIVTDAYAQRLLLEKKKQETLARLNNLRTSNIELQMGILQLGLEYAQKYDDAQALLQADQYAKTKSDLNTVENWNSVKRAEGATAGLKADAAKTNHWLNAERSQISADAAATKSYIYDMYKDLGKYKQFRRMLDREQQLNGAWMTMNDKLTKLDNLNSEVSNPKNWPMLPQYAHKIITDLTNPAGFTDAEIAIINRYSNITDPNVLMQALTNDAQFRNLIITKLTTGTDELSKAFRAAYESYIDRVNTDYDRAYHAAQRDFLGVKLSSPAQISNQIYKKGGKVQLLKELVKLRQRELDSDRKSSKDFHARVSKELSKQLGSLDKEQLMLLKSIFS